MSMLMYVLRRIYNPISDTFLVLEDSEVGTKRYRCYREQRFCYELPASASKQLRPYASSSLASAEAVFDERAKHEKLSRIESLVGDIYISPNETGLIGQGKSLLDFFRKAAYIKHLGLKDYFFRLCDPGAQRLYIFENSYFSTKKRLFISQEETEKLAIVIAKKYGFAKPKIHFSEEKIFYRPLETEVLGLANIYKKPYEITLKTYGGRVEKRVFLHEMAHLVTDNCFGTVISHGPHFALAMTHLYDRHIGLNKAEYFDLANQYRFKIFGPDTVQAEDILNADFTRGEECLWKDILRNTQLEYPSASYSPAV